MAYKFHLNKVLNAAATFNMQIKISTSNLT